MKKIAVLVALFMFASMGAANADAYDDWVDRHNTSKYSKPELESLRVLSCTTVRVRWDRTSNFTSVNYARSKDFRGHLSMFPSEFGTRDEVRRDERADIPNLRPGARYWFRVHASDYAGNRQSRYSNVRSIRLPSC